MAGLNNSMTGLFFTAVLTSYYLSTVGTWTTSLSP